MAESEALYEDLQSIHGIPCMWNILRIKIRHPQPAQLAVGRDVVRVRAELLRYTESTVSDSQIR